MSDNIPQKTPKTPLFDFTTMANSIASLQRNQLYIGADMPNLMKDFDLPPGQANADMDEDIASALTLTAFSLALKKGYSVQMMLPRKHWDYIKTRKPAEINNIASVREVFYMNPQVVNIEFQPKAQD